MLLSLFLCIMQGKFHPKDDDRIIIKERKMNISSIAQPVQTANEIFRFVDSIGAQREVEIDADTFFCVCVGGFQVGDAHSSPVAANEHINRLVEDGEHLTLITVETYRQADGDEYPVAANPHFIRGCWEVQYPN